MNTTEIKARIYDLIVLIEQAKAEISQLQSAMEAETKESANVQSVES